eukprot:jgi/Tetstr1/447299/TSEL_034736.t1
MSNTEFVSVPNMRRLMTVLDTHFSDNLGIDLATLGVPMKQFLHRVMKNVRKEYGKDHDIHDMNKVAVKIAKDFLMQVAKSQYESQQFHKQMELVAPMYPPPPPDCEGPVDPIVDNADTGQELAEKMKRFEEERERMAMEPPPDIKFLPPVDQSKFRKFPEAMDVSIGNPYVDYSSAIDMAKGRDGTACRVLNPGMGHLVDQNKPESFGGGASGLGGGLFGPGGSTGSGGDAGFDMIIPRVEKKRIVDRFLMVNGFNRDFGMYKNRFEFQVNLNQNNSTFSDIRSIAAVKLIIPREIMEERSITNIPNTNYNHRFGLRHQYLILQVDEFQNVYRSPSLPSSRAFTHFVYDTSHTTPFGRDYVSLCPVMGEEVKFDTNVYTQLSSMTLSVRQPNGALLNDSRDDYRLFKLDYDETNSKHMNIRLGRYFSKNEFFVGDVVRFEGFRARYHVGPDPGDYFAPAGAAALEQFINREEGHNVLEVIDATASGYYSSFYIQAPGSFDAGTGLFEVDLDLVDGDPFRSPQSVLYQVNQNITFPASLAEQDAALFEIGKCVNMSLQVAIAFKIKVEEDDVTV